MTTEPEPSRERDRMRKLLLDAMLGKLATYLRMFGYDAAYALDRGIERDEELLCLASKEERLLLTRDRQLAARAARSSECGAAVGSVLLSERRVTEQLRELRETGVELSLADSPTRCGNCNGRLLSPTTDTPRPEYVPDDERVWRCQDCGQWFWKGSHWDDVADRLEDIE